MNVYRSSGDLGDCVFSLAAVKHLGTGTYVLVDRPWTAVLTRRAHLIEPLLRSQSYIYDVKVGDGHGLEVTHDFSTFRNGGLPWGRSLAALHAEWIGVPAGTLDFTKPWICIDPTPGLEKKVILARSPRYNTAFFPWKQIVEFLGKDALFVGLEMEHVRFCEAFGEVEYLPTRNLLELAGVISGSHSMVANQSSPNSLAEALKHRRILEVAPHVPDCCIGGGDVQYSCDGAVTIIRPSDGEVLSVPAWVPPREVNLDVTPPGLFQFKLPNGDVLSGITYGQIRQIARQQFQYHGLPFPADFEQQLIKQTGDRLPGYGVPRWFESQRELFSKIKQLTNKQ